MSTIKSERESLLAQIEALKAKNAALFKQQQSEFRVQVSEKGAVSVYGLGRFPVTLYKEQWDTLISHIADVQKYMNENTALLKVRK